MIIRAIDPGDSCGVAEVREGALTSCVVFKSPKDCFFLGTISHSDYTVVEVPQVYNLATAASLVTLSITLGRYIAKIGSGRIYGVWPHDWKGSVDKTVHNQRVLATLTPEERALIPTMPRAKRPIHDAVDAAGLAKWAHNEIHRAKMLRMEPKFRFDFSV